jgi:hypothetical protein
VNDLLAHLDALIGSSNVIDGAKSPMPPLCGGIGDFAGQLRLTNQLVEPYQPHNWRDWAIRPLNSAFGWTWPGG